MSAKSIAAYGHFSLDCILSGCPTRSPSQRHCPTQYFRCKNTLCVHKVWVCDGEDDCGDESDESPKFCGK